VLALDEEKARIDALLTGLVTKTAPRLLEVDGVGIDTAAACISPVIAAAAFPMPAAEPVLLALAAGVIAQAAWMSLRAAFHCLRTAHSRSPRPLQSPPWPPSSPRWLCTRPAEHAREHATAHRAYAPIGVRSGSAMVTWRC
jgi:hypothetical protein